MTNESGMTPVEDKVLVLPDVVSEDVGLIRKPDIVREKEQGAQVVSTLIAAGPNAFEEWGDPIPQPGDKIYSTKYSGIMDILGEDGQKYQIICDRDITAIVSVGFRKVQEGRFKGTRQPLGGNNE